MDALQYTTLYTQRLEPAPESLLHIITCNCRSGCERNCECRRSGLPCTSMCGFCAGHGCSNHDTSDDTSDGEDYMSGSDEDALDAQHQCRKDDDASGGQNEGWWYFVL